MQYLHSPLRVIFVNHSYRGNMYFQQEINTHVNCLCAVCTGTHHYLTDVTSFILLRCQQTYIETDNTFSLLIPFCPVMNILKKKRIEPFSWTICIDLLLFIYFISGSSLSPRRLKQDKLLRILSHMYLLRSFYSFFLFFSGTA